MVVSRRHAALGGIALLVALVVAVGLMRVAFASLHGRLEVPHPGHVWLTDPVTVQFSQDIDFSAARVTISPNTPVTVTSSKQALVIRPVSGWEPHQQYAVALGDLPTADQSATLKGWRATFTTQPNVAVADFKVAGKTDDSPADMSLRSSLAIDFTVAMKPSTVHITVNDQAPLVNSLSWTEGNTTAAFSPPQPLPDQTFDVKVASGFSQQGDPLVDPREVKLTTLGLEPSNSSSGIGPDFKTVAPIEIVVENSGPARPQSGLQQADMVYEYISEYSITRMTAIYFNHPPALIGPVRSCRLISIPLNLSFDGVTMCSGVSPGTHARINLAIQYGAGEFDATTRQNPRRMHVLINDYDNGNHFSRVGFMFAPHNLYTDQGRALRWRAEQNLPSPNYVIDPAHPDNDLGQPVPAPSVPVQAVRYTYNPSSKLYARFDHGTPFIDAGTRAQVQVKNVILLHVGYRVMNYVEDESGGAHSIYYELVGQGPAEIYSDGKLAEATWHGSWDASPMYFTDAQGNFIELNTGLTWVHVLGNGQAS